MKTTAEMIRTFLSEVIRTTQLPLNTLHTLSPRTIAPPPNLLTLFALANSDVERVYEADKASC
jgi:antitoxin component of RelBE/YafQ-DinJ toxin-antitoxin module